MWDTLEVTHEGTNEVKRAWKHTLIQEYEMFRMLKGETVEAGGSFFPTKA